MIKPSPQRQDNRNYVTPLVADILFFEIVDITRICPPGEDPPAYGTAHPDTEKYPNFKLSYIQNADDQGLKQKWYYCKDRANQEDYNYALSYPYSGNTQYPRITRTYVLLRGQAPLALGSADPGLTGVTQFQYYQPSASAFTYLQPSPSTFTYLQPFSASSAAVLVAQSEEPIPVEEGVGSLYVKITRIYDVLPGSDDTIPGSGASQTNAGYTIERPLGTDSFFRLTWKLTLPRTVADNAIQDNYTACPISGFGSLVLVDETIKQDDSSNQTSAVTRVYEGNATGVAFPSAEKVRYQGKFYPSNLPPEKFVLAWRKMSDTYLTDSPENQNVSTPATVPVAAPLGKYDALVGVESKPKNVLTGEKETTWYTDIEVATLYGENWDDNLRDYVPFTTFVIPSSEYVNIGEPEIGTQRDVTPLGTGWSVVTVQAPRETSIEILTSPFADLSGSARSYLDSIPDQWPRVLKRFFVGTTPSGNSLYYDYEFSPDEYSGPCIACFQVAWSKSPPMITSNPTLVATAFNPTSLRINWPEVINIQIPDCLHSNPETIVGVPAGTYVFTGPLGTTYYKAWEPTTLGGVAIGDWPDSYVKNVSVTPYLGGYRLEKITVHKPDIS
jgi:hypothetical protein